MGSAVGRAVRGSMVIGLTTLVAWGSWLGTAHWVPLPKDFFTPGSTAVTFEDGSFAHVFLSPDDKWRIPVRLEEIDPAYVKALLRLEDKRFYEHGGVDVWAVMRAAITNVFAGRVVSGASTLTMQLVRVREPRPRTLASKVKEAFRSAQIEARYDKDEILAKYLEYIPYGRNLEGIEAASLSYFGHRAAALSPEEIATLLAVPQNPNRRYPSSRHRARLKAARDEIATKLAGWSALKGRPEAVHRTPVPTRLRRFPRWAPHAAYWLKDDHANRDRIPTTLTRRAQQHAESIMDKTAEARRRQGIRHGAIVVVDHESGRVLALAGSSGFWTAKPGQQIPSFDVPRSPGSALKPFIYGLGIDDGRILPEHLVLDVPVSYGTYVPHNYDERFSGLVRAEDALSRSLNVPFVNLLHDIRVERFIGNLRAWGVDALDDRPGHYGLSAAIGGLELTPLELAGVYAMLARGGRHKKLTVLRDDESAPEETAGLSAGSAYLVKRALRIKDRPDFPARRRMRGVPRGIHWKTGTSYGHRDAWAAGSNARYTAVVWLGNLDQSPSGHLVGADAAGPLLFDVLEGLAEPKDAHQAVPPSDLTRVEVCRYSGHVPAEGCPHTTWVWARTTAVPTKPCPYHVMVDIDDETGLAIGPACRRTHAHHTASFLTWPASLRRWVQETSRHAPSPPAFLAGCEGAAASDPPRIVSPARGQTILLIPGVDPEEQEVPLAAESNSPRLSWFVNGRFLGTRPSEARRWWVPQPGRHSIVVTDEAGRSAETTVVVRAGFGRKG